MCANENNVELSLQKITVLRQRKTYIILHEDSYLCLCVHILF